MHLLLLVAAVWLGGLALGGAVPALPGGPALALVAFGAATVAVLPGAARWQPRARPLLAVVAAALAGLAAAPSPAPAQLAPDGLCRLEGEVLGVRHGQWGPRSTVRVTRGERLEDGAAVPPGTRVSLNAALPPGGRVRSLARLRTIPRYRNPTPHPDWPRVNPIDATGRLPPGATVEVLHREPLGDALERARAGVRSALDRSLAPRSAGIARALVLGDGGAVEPEARDVVRDAGLAHVLAVSGLHVSLVAGLLYLLLRTLLVRVPGLAERVETRRLAAGAAVPLALLHAVFAGGSPSAWRAALTAAIALSLVAAGRRPHPLAVAATAVLVLGVIDPGKGLRPATLLSVLATLAVLGTRAPTPGSAASWLRAAFSLSARTTLATAPVVLWCFGEVPVVGVLANVVLLPLATLLLVPLALLHALIATAVPELALLTAGPFEGVSQAFVAACDGFASLLPRADLPPPTLVQGLVLGVGCTTALFIRRGRTMVALVAVALLALAGAEAHVRHVERPVGLLRVTFLDVGQGDATLVDFPNGEAMLVDAGGSRSAASDPGREVVVPLLAARRRSRVAVAVLTHPHPDHYGGLGAVLGSTSLAELWDNEQAHFEHPGGEVARLVERSERHGVRVMKPATLCGRARRFGDARVEVLAPCPRYDPGHDLNDNSFVLRVSLGSRALLLTGDAEEAGEGALLESGRDLSADVLQVGHHGSRTSSTPAFLSAVRPSLAVVSCGGGNRFGHPHREVMSRLRGMGVRVMRTDRHGGVVWVTDGRQAHVTSWSGEAFTLPMPRD